MKAKITRYPNHEVRVAVYPERFPKSLDELNDGLPDDVDSLEKCLVTPYPVERLDSPDSASSDAFNIKSKVDTPLRPRKLYLSRNGRNTILRAGACFSDDPSSERLLLTGTLPGRLREAMQALAEFSTYATKTLCNWLTRRSPKCKWLYCWEFQKRGALHIHLVVELPRSIAAYVKEHFQDEWNRILTTISNRSGVNLYKRTHKYVHSKKVTQADVAVCDRQPSRYISKYISKKATNGFGSWRYPPKTWYQASRSILATLREKTQTFIAEGLSYRQALTFIEDATHCLSQSIRYGERRFEGAILAWSGYCYDEHFNIQEWGNCMSTDQRNLMAIRTMYMSSLGHLRDNPNALSYLRMKNIKLVDNHDSLNKLTDEQMVDVIGTVMQSVMATWQYCIHKNKASRYMKMALGWWEAKFESAPFNESAILEVVAFNEESLTN